MTTAMTKYYKADIVSKSKAASVIQSCIRRYLERKFSFMRSFVVKDNQLQRKIQDKIIARKKVRYPFYLLTHHKHAQVCLTIIFVADGGALQGCHRLYEARDRTIHFFNNVPTRIAAMPPTLTKPPNSQLSDTKEKIAGRSRRRNCRYDHLPCSRSYVRAIFAYRFAN